MMVKSDNLGIQARSMNAKPKGVWDYINDDIATLIKQEREEEIIGGGG
jgi:hypothetical protein